MMTKSFKFKTTGVILSLFLFLVIASVGFMGVVTSETSASAATLTYSGNYTIDYFIDLNTGTNFTKTYSAPGVDLEVINLFTISADGDDWITDFLESSNSSTEVKLNTTYKAEDGEEAEMVIMYKLPIRNKNSASLTTPYAVLESAKVSGNCYDGTYVSNVDVYSIDRAGFYSFTGDIEIKVVLGTVTSYNPGNETHAVAGINNFQQIATKTDHLNLKSTNLLLQSKLMLNANQMGAYINNNLNIPQQYRIYGESENYRDLVRLHDTKLAETGSFVFSTKVNSNYNVSSQDIRLFEPYKKGLGTITEQIEGVESGANSITTNLSGISNALTINWYERDGEAGSYSYSKQAGAIKNAGNYFLRIECAYEFKYELSPVVVMLNNAIYEQQFEIIKRDLYLDINNSFAINALTGKEYDKNNNASTLFSNVAIERAFFTGAMNGIDSDYDILETYINASTLFQFDGSVFADSTIADNKTVYMKVEFRSILEESPYRSTMNYNPVPVFGTKIDNASDLDNYQYNAFSIITTGIYAGKYNLGAIFSIFPNKLSVHFSKGTLEDDKPKFESNITYGAMLNATGYDFEKYLVTTATVNKNIGGNNILCPENHDDWKIVFCNGELPNPIPTDTAHNTIFIIVKAGTKLSTQDASNAAFIDGEGNSYISYTGRLFAGEYYLYYEVYVRHTNGSGGYITGNRGVFNIATPAGNKVVELFLTEVQPLKVERKLLQVTVSSLEPIKNYDGTDTVNNFSASAEGIINEDAAAILFQASAKYAYAGAGDSVGIEYDFRLVGSGQGQSTAIINQIIASYQIDNNNIHDGTGLNIDINKGRINKLELKIDFVESEYSRKYYDLTYVAVRVGIKGVHVGLDGNLLQEDYYYYHLNNEMTSNGMNGYCPESELNDVFQGNTYIKLFVSGFLEGEGFVWNKNYYDVEDFMMNKATDPEYYQPLYLDTFSMLTWYDEIKSTVINRLTSSSQKADDKYRLQINEAASLPNYSFVAASDNAFGWLKIDKLDVKEDDIKIYPDNPENTLTYDGTANIGRLFTQNKISYSNHQEYNLIQEIINNDPSEMIAVINYICHCEIAGHIHEFDKADIDSLKLAGQYSLVLTIPSTDNYNEYVVELEVKVFAKTVNVYVTFPFRVFGDAELEYDKYAYIDDIGDHTVIVDMNGNIVESGGNVAYAFEKNLSNGNMILYSGFIGDEKIGGNPDEENAIVRINISEDRAGTHSNAVEPYGAVKHNYTFNYNKANLYVKKKALTISSASVQEKYYTGDVVAPDYEIAGGPGVLAMYIVGMNDELDEVEDETKVNVIDAGVYNLKVYAKPDMSGGASDNNYDVSNVRLSVRLTVLKTPLQLIESSKTAQAVYNGQSYELNHFSQYFQGVGKDGAIINADYKWGRMEILSAQKNGFSTSPENIVDSGVYQLTVLATIDNDNVYFAAGNQGTHEFEIALTITKSDVINFMLSVSDGISLSNDGKYKMVYSGSEAVFGYSMIVSGKEADNGEIIGVVGTVGDYLYSINQNVYYADDPIYNQDKIDGMADRIPGVEYKLDARAAMKDVQTYTLKYYINYDKIDSYNPNYVTLIKEFTFIIEKQTLRVFINFNEGYGPYKIYMESNASVEEQVFYTYSGWVENEGLDESVISQIVSPTIDWSEVAEDATASGSYNIYSQGGTAPSNYVFDHSYSGLPFEVRKAEAWIRVYGFYDEDNDMYTDYTIYNGREQEPLILRMAGNKPIDPEKEVIGNDGIKITFEGLFVGADKNNISAADIAPYSSSKDAGRYVFSVSVVASMNYNAIESKYYYMEIRKADLGMYFVQVNNAQTGDVSKGQGYASKIYDGKEIYPSYSVIYEGFVGEDSDINAYKNVFQITHINTFDPLRDAVKGLELQHPYYQIIDDRNESHLPLSIGYYGIRVVTGDDYGVAKNYNIIVNYTFNDDNTLYPILEITSRPVDVIAGDTVIKVYDATNKIKDGLIKSNNYRFIKTRDAEGNEIESSGLIEGDVVEIRFNLNTSVFERSTVLDEDGIASEVKIKIYGFDITDKNYRLDISELYSDANGEYFILNGSITPASADIRFTDADGGSLTNKLEVVYNAQRHEVKAIVNGVLLENGTFEEVEYEIKYKCEATNYDTTDAPRDAQTYIVELRVLGSNYQPTQRSLDLVILKAEVEIVFGGDIVQTYGSVTGGITAIAYGVGGHTRTLTVLYKESDMNVSDITVANAGTYSAVAIYEESTNFKRTEKRESFTIKKRGVYTVANVASGYPYSGKPVVIDIYFNFNGIKYYPTLRFNEIKSDGLYPFNYGENAIGTGYPVNAGEYQVAADQNYSNFEILDNYWSNFSILPVNLKISVQDMTVTYGEEYSFYYLLNGTVNNERIEQALTVEPTLEFYTAAGERLASLPTSAGVYRVKPNNAESVNYILSYDYGILTLNKSVVELETPANSFTGEGSVIVEGSFLADTSLVVRVADTLQYNQFNTIFELFKVENKEFEKYTVAGIYHLKMSDGSVTMSNGGNMTVKIYAKDYFNSLPQTAYAANENTNYYVARISGDGSVRMLEARKDGDYLVFETDRLEAFAILTDVVSVEGGGLDWLLYVGIGVGVLLIILALIIVKKRA